MFSSVNDICLDFFFEIKNIFLYQYAHFSLFTLRSYLSNLVYFIVLQKLCK